MSITAHLRGSGWDRKGHNNKVRPPGLNRSNILAV